MDPFRLEGAAASDFEAIWAYLHEKGGLEVADRVVNEIYKGFERVGRVPNSGHRRPDVTDEQLLFYTVFSYLIVYKPLTEPVSIIGVFHGKRDLAGIIKQRLET